MKFSLKEFLYFMRTGRARQPQTVKVNTEEKEQVHLKYVQSIDELLAHGSNIPSPKPKYDPRLDTEQHKPFYTLSEGQYRKLEHSANIGGVAWIVPSPTTNDDEAHRIGLGRLCQEIADLEALGLAQDVSEHFKEQVEHTLKLHGRHVRFMAATQLAVIMFASAEGRPIN